MNDTTSTSMRVGMVGVGGMGMSVARRLSRAGYALNVFARRAEVRAEAETLGATTAESLAALGEASDVVIINVFSDDQVRDVALGADGVVEHMRAGSVLISHTTGRPSTIREVEAAARTGGVRTLDCAMSGGPADIDAGQLTLLVGGEAATLQEVRPLLESYCDPILPVGEVGDGQKVKLLNNALFGAQVALVSHIERCASDLDMDPPLALRAIQACSGDSYALGVAVMMGSASNLVDGARRYLEKDVAVCAEVAAELGADLESVLSVARSI